MVMSQHLHCGDMSAPEPSTDLAIKRLDGFKFVGLVEHWALSMCLFHTKLGGTCTELDFANMRPGRRPMEETPNPYSQMLDQDDERVYEAVSEKFWADVKKFGVNRRSCMKTCKEYTAPFEIGQDSISLQAKRLDSFDFSWPSQLAVDESLL